MRKIIFEDVHRQKHFDFFRQMDQPHFNICAPVDITMLLPIVKEKGLHFTSTVVYLIARIANDMPVFRRRIRGEELIEHEAVHPSFTVPTEVSEVFSFCTVNYDINYERFVAASQQTIQRMWHDPSFEDEPGRDDYLFLSSLPWVSFTGLTHAMHYSPVDSVPRITWGKYYTDNGRTRMPLSVQAHHAIVDGRDVGLYFQQLEEMIANTDNWLL